MRYVRRFIIWAFTPSFTVDDTEDMERVAKEMIYDHMLRGPKGGNC